MKLHNVIQGSEQWLALRAGFFTASDAPAMMGVSPYATRADLLRRKHTGIVEEVDEATQRRFDAGHQTEAAFRPIAEEILDGEDLAAVTGSIEIDGMQLLASFDGLTFDRSTGYEHKLFNASLARTIEADGEPGPAYYWQMEHQLLVSGAQRILFVTSDGSRDCMAHCFYESKPERRAKLIAGWKQFAEDLAAYEPEPAPAAQAVGRTPDNLPALHIEIRGEVRASNLVSFHEHAMSVLGSINRTLTTDQQFADAEKAVKWCERVERDLDFAKKQALSQTASIEQLFRTIDDVKAETRTVRLELFNLVKARKEAIREEIVADGIKRLRDHVQKLNTSLGRQLLPTIPADFGGAIKGKKTIQSMRDAVDQVLADAKLLASDFGARIAQNLRTIDQHQDLAHLFPDQATLVLKMPEDLQAVVANRVAEHQRKEAERLEAERERIRREEQERADREARERQAAADAEVERQAKAAIAAAATPAPAVVAQPQPSTPVVAQKPAVVSDNAARIKLGQINDRLAPLSITADGLAELGFEPVATERASKLYRETDFQAICAAIVERVRMAAALQAA
ncbi:MAG: YqaJ viral recombinase family protein [Hydrogenophaga sp.]|uniref:YqaJ viral recombinase family protein n=1 Tax=Hydrogenophaga sp. TaxID=1904254 RepID=UPI001D69944B|nr:YqaJ viral recombinase family protein [Hydrogenophaga sp.]MBX3610363.1 YqaJ viral recombinase family protein [Hydrogenophaga sp.]